jgi:capsular exopolysaccharide synthesis family protein
METEPLPATPNRATIATLFFNRLHRLINILRGRWWVLVLTMTCAVGGEMLWLKKSPPAYYSLGCMIVSAKLSLPNASAYNEELNNFLGTQVGLLQSDVVSNRALARLRSSQSALQPLPIVLEVKVSPKTSIFNLRATASHPAYATAFVQATMEEFMALKKEMLRDTSDTTQTGLQSVLAQLRTELNAAQQELIQYGASNREVYLQEQGNSAADYLALLTRQLANLKSELRLLTTLTLDENVERLVGLPHRTLTSQGTAPDGAELTKQVQAQQALAQETFTHPALGAALSKTSPPDPALPGGVTASQSSVAATQLARETPGKEQDQATLVGSETEYLKAKQEILMIQAQRDDLGRYLRPKHPKMIALNEDIEKMEKLLEIFRGQTKDQLKAREHTFEVQIANLAGDIQVWEAKSVEISKKMTGFQDIKEKIRRLQNMSDSLFASESTVNLEKEISPESVSILEAATPGVLVEQPFAGSMAPAAALGLVLGMVALLFLDRLDDRPHSLVEIQRSFVEPVLGQIPHLRLKDKSASIPLLTENDQRHALAEAYRSLRSSIMAQGSDEDHPKLILVTSAVPCDGKSMTASNLAVMLARSGARVLLLDGDLRRGGLHKQFALPESPGLAEVLGGTAPWSAVAREVAIANLSVLPRGAIPRHPGELLARSVKQTFLQEARSRYDYVLVDTTPIMAADDVANLAPHVDGVLMVIRANHTSSRVARAAMDLLCLRKARILGIVFNGVRSLGGDYYYYKYKQYYAPSPNDP